jgi:hypothetical protein
MTPGHILATLDDGFPFTWPHHTGHPMRKLVLFLTLMIGLAAPVALISAPAHANTAHPDYCITSYLTKDRVTAQGTPDDRALWSNPPTLGTGVGTVREGSPIAQPVVQVNNGGVPMLNGQKVITKVISLSSPVYRSGQVVAAASTAKGLQPGRYTMVTTVQYQLSVQTVRECYTWRPDSRDPNGGYYGSTGSVTGALPENGYYYGPVKTLVRSDALVVTPVIDRAEYNAIRPDMTKAKVAHTIGGPGRKVAAWLEGNGQRVEWREWDRTGGRSRTAAIMFVDGRVARKVWFY